MSRRALLIAVAGSLAACHVYDASLLDRSGQRDAGSDSAVDGGQDAGLDADLDAGVDAGEPPDAGTDAGPPVDAGCALLRPPERPTIADGDSQPIRWYAVHRLRLGTGASWRDVSYDVDGLCTDPLASAPEVECAPPPGFAPPSDGPGGTDNSFGQAFVPLITLLFPQYEEDANAGVADGSYGLLLRIDGWNGTDDDPLVDAALVDSPGGHVAGFVAVDGGTPPPLAWDGTDEWTASTRSFVSGDTERPLARDTAAYVTGGLLVVRPRQGTELNITGAQKTFTLRLSDAVVTARLSDGARQLTEGILAGRWTLDDIFDTLPSSAICPGTSQYTAAQEALRRTADVTSDGSSTPFLLCNAISVGVGFDAQLVQLAGYGEGRPVVDFCTM